MLFRIALALRSSRTSFSSSLLCLVGGGAGPGVLVDLGLLDPGVQSLGVDTQLLADPADRALGPRRVKPTRPTSSSWTAHAAHRDTSSVP